MGFSRADKVGKNACALVAQPAVAFWKALFRLTTAIAIEAQRLCLCNLQGNNSLDPLPCTDKVGKERLRVGGATCGCFLDGLFLRGLFSRKAR